MLADFRSAIRSLVRAPGFSLLVIVTLAIGIGPTTAIFSVINALMLRQLPYRDAESLAIVWRHRNQGDRAPMSGPDFHDVRRMNASFEDMAIASWGASYNVGDIDQPVRVEGARVTPNFFPLLGTPAASGIVPTSAEGRVVAISHSLWQQTFGGANVIGRDVRLNGEPHRIVAVMPREFAFPPKADLWLPFDLRPDDLGHRALHRWRVVGRLRPGVSVRQAEADVKRIAARLGELYPETTRGIGISVESFRDAMTGDVRRPLAVLFGAVVFLLLIACSNAANLMLTRGAARQRELAIRSALGASRGRLARQLLIEAVVLAVAAGGVGLVLTALALRLVRHLGTAYLPRPELITADGAVLAFNFAVAAVTGIIFGLAPASTRTEVFTTLRGGTRTSTHGGWESRAARESIVVAVVALSFFLLIGAGLLLHSFSRVREIDVGVRTERVVTARIFLPEKKYPDIDVRGRFFEQVLDRLRATPGIDAAAGASGLPLENTMSGDITFPGESDPVASRRIAGFTMITSGYFATMGIPMYEGRDFTRDDTLRVAEWAAAVERGEANPPTPPVIISRAMALRFYAARSPLGQRVLVGGDLPAQIIGVAGDVKQGDPRKATTAHVYMPLGSPLPPVPMSFVVRSSTLPPSAVIAAIRQALRELDPDVPPYLVRTMPEVIASAVAAPRFATVLLTILAAIALALATIGIYGVISYGVARRTREFGIRIATGASARDLLKLVVVRVLQLAMIGIAVGSVGALMLTRWLDTLLFEVSAADPRVFAAVAVVLVGTALVASAAPARRAARVDAMTSLRYE